MSTDECTCDFIEINRYGLTMRVPDAGCPEHGGHDEAEFADDKEQD